MNADDIILKSLPENATLFTKSEFKRQIGLGYLTEDDGVGAWATETQYSDVGVIPSIGTITLLNYPPHEKFTHILWFNH